MTNNFIIGLFMVSACLTAFSLHYRLDNINSEVERVHVESIISSGKAIYMPGNVCILKATSDISAEKMKEFAAACIHSHRQWLLIKDKETTYLDDTEHKK